LATRERERQYVKFRLCSFDSSGVYLFSLAVNKKGGFSQYKYANQNIYVLIITNQRDLLRRVIVGTTLEIYVNAFEHERAFDFFVAKLIPTKAWFYPHHIQPKYKHQHLVKLSIVH
jgi:hypothetical protein